MNARALLILALAGSLGLLAGGCATYNRRGLETDVAAQLEPRAIKDPTALSPAQRQAILALDPLNVTEQDVRTVLAGAPAPRIFTIHGGIYPVHTQMIGLCEFLIGMGYPGDSITNIGDGTYTFSCYESSEKIAGVVAWHYARDGLRPMMFGHSQGGMQTVKVLQDFAGMGPERLHVWNPLTWKEEEATEIRDPLTGEMRPVVGLQLSFASAVGAGGLTRVLPNQWDMMNRLRKIPNTVVEFTGYLKKMDLLGGDMLGYGDINLFRSMDQAVVRNVWLPTEYHHRAIPNAKHLLKSRRMVEWINNYRPPPDPVVTLEFPEKKTNENKYVLYAADLWFSIKKHWVLELQRRIRAEEARGSA